MLTAKNIHKKYGSLEVLKGVDLTINKGEIVSIVGSSGAGKSTLLHILGTLDKADKGEIYLNNQRMDTLAGKKLARFRNNHIGLFFNFIICCQSLMLWKMFAFPAGLQVRIKKK